MINNIINHYYDLIKNKAYNYIFTKYSYLIPYHINSLE